MRSVNKVFVLAPNENWIVDRFVNEWYEDNSDISTKNPLDADVIWLLADWCWNQLPIEFLKTKKVITTVHHIVPEKFTDNDRKSFALRDSVTDVYHVYNQQTLDFIKRFTKKPIHLIPYWANQKIWKKTGSKLELREKYDLPINAYLIGSFQRDTEGHDLISPKLEKGPDLLADYIIYKNSLNTSEKIHVVLAGWRRQYLVKRLTDANIQFSYFERPSHEVINDLYQCLDLYPVSARCEGGPQALIECGLLNIPVISRNVGIASQILPIHSVSDDLRFAQPSIPNVSKYTLPEGYLPYKKLIETL
jgi:hypothetical protein